MKKELSPVWSKAEQEEGKRLHQAWDSFFANRAPGEQPQHSPALAGPDDRRLAEVRARHEEALLRYPNVVGVDEGFRIKGGRPTDTRCLIVYVARKVRREALAPEALLPEEIEGIPVDVVAIGEIKPLSA